jgi:hypothetical protein
MPVRRAGIAIVSSGVENLSATSTQANFAARQTMYPCDNPAARKAHQKVNPLRPRATIDSSVKSHLQTIIHSANRCPS